MFLFRFVISICSIAVSLAHNGHHHGHPFIDKRDASNVLNNECKVNRRSECCTNIAHETWCEKNKPYCMEVNESGREEKCKPDSCPSGQTCYLYTPCKAHYEIRCDSTDPCLAFPCHNEGTCVKWATNTFFCSCKPGYDTSTNCATACKNNPCQNGATCHDYLNGYSCTCVPGFTGINCETNIDECTSGPCINDGTCIDHVNFFTCDCTDRYTGALCEKDCRPGPVDLLFVLDTSSSSRDDCDRIKDYMSTIVNQIPVGPDDFQIAAITYSFRPTLQWSFSQYSDNKTVLQAIDTIHCTGGATYTGKAIEYAIEFFSDPANGGRHKSAYKQIVLITDGLSTDRSNTIQQSWNVVAKGIKLYVVGLGHYVDHRELHAMVHDSRYVFSTKDNECLLTMFRETAHPDCNDCLEDSSTDIVLLLDSSSKERIKYSTKATIELVEYLDVGNTDIQMGIMSYSEATQVILPIEKHTQNDLSSSITKTRLRSTQETNISDAIKSGKTELDNFGRTNSKKVLVLFTDGNGNTAMESKSFIQDTVGEGINVFIFGIGEDVGHETIRNIVTDSFYGLLSADTNDYTPLRTIKSESWRTTCNENIFHIRV